MAMEDWTAGLNTLTNSINQATATFGTAAQTKRQIREAWKYQTRLDEAAHQRAIENWNRENAYNEQMYLKYQTPEAQRRMLEEAGYNPEVLAGSGSGGSAPQSGGITTIGSSQAPTMSTPRWDFRNLGEDLIAAMTQAEELAAKRDEKIARRYEIDARRIENNRKELQYFRELMDSSEDAGRLSHERWKRGEDQSAANRAQDAFDMEMRRIRQDLTHGVNEETRKQALFGSEIQQRELQYWLNQEALTEQQWRRKYRERYGRNPERNETVGDFLFKLSEDTGLLNLVGEVGSDVANTVGSVYRAGKKAVGSISDISEPLSTVIRRMYYRGKDMREWNSDPEFVKFKNRRSRK